MSLLAVDEPSVKATAKVIDLTQMNVDTVTILQELAAAPEAPAKESP